MRQRPPTQQWMQHNKQMPMGEQHKQRKVEYAVVVWCDFGVVGVRSSVVVVWLWCGVVWCGCGVVWCEMRCGCGVV